jgi:5-methylcytosine-specific restriction endonuclease McrA
MTRRRKRRPTGSIRYRDEYGEANRCGQLLVLAERQNWRCCYCGKRMTVVPNRRDTATYEHVTPHAVVRNWDLDNLVVACAACNGARHGHFGRPRPVGARQEEKERNRRRGRDASRTVLPVPTISGRTRSL